MDRNGNVDPHPPVFELSVPLPWYREAGFLCILGFSALTIAGLVWLLVSRYRQLRAAKIAAEAASLSKSAFLANMSHEIRTPDERHHGHDRPGAGNRIDRGTADYLLTAKTSADQLLTLLNDILDFSKIEAGKLDISPVDFLLRECIADSLHTLVARADDKGLDLLCRVAPEVPDELVGDPGRLRQILINLVGNAIKFTAARRSGGRGHAGSARRRGRADCCTSGWPIPASESRRTSSRRCSSRSNRPMRRPRESTAARAWAWRSPAGWWN